MAKAGVQLDPLGADCHCNRQIPDVERLLEALAKHIYPMIYIGLLIYQGNQVTILRERLTSVEILAHGISERTLPARKDDP